MYCVNENEDAKAHFVFFFNFSFCHSYITADNLSNAKPAVQQRHPGD